MANKCKFEKEREWVSYDGGIVWNPTDNYRIGKLIEPNSEDCDGIEPSEPMYRWIDVEDGDCADYKRHTVSYEEMSTDYGKTWFRSGKSEDKGMEYSTNCMDGYSVLAFDSSGTIRLSKSWTEYVELTQNQSKSANNHTVLVNTVKIGDYAVYISNIQALDNIKVIKISDSVTDIGNWAFSGCTSLSSLTIGNNVETIGQNAFQYCSSLASLVIPDSVKTIGRGAFYGCNSLTSLTIPNSVETIGDSVFGYCSSLASLVIPDSVKTIGERAFHDCNSLTSVVISDNVTEIGFQAFSGCTSLESLRLGNSVKTIGERAFRGCRSLTSLTIPNSVETISDYGFDTCGSVTSLVIPDSVKTIGSGAFDTCESLTSLTIGNSVETIGNRGFYHCNSLASFTIYATVPPRIYSDTFEKSEYSWGSITKLSSIYVPDESVDAYKNASGWKSYASIIKPISEKP